MADALTNTSIVRSVITVEKGLTPLTKSERGDVSGIYCIKNKTNDKVYIGSSENIKERWFVHKSLLSKNVHHSRHLQKSWNKYGEKNFLFFIIEHIDDLKELIKREQFYLDTYKSYDEYNGYNIRKIADSSLGCKRSDETKKRMSLAQKNVGHNEWFGRNHLSVSKLKISNALKGRVFSEEHRSNLSKAGSLRKHSEETKIKMRKRRHSEETLNKMRITRKGTRPSEECMKKARLALRKYWLHKKEVLLNV